MALVVRMTFLVLAVVIANGDVFAQANLSGKRIAKTYEQEQYAGRWSTETIYYSEHGLPDQPDREIAIYGRDTLVENWYFRPQLWMTEHCISPIALIDIDPEHPSRWSIDAQQIDYRLKPGDPATVIEEEFRNSRLGNRYRNRIRYATYDRESGRIVQSIDSIFHESGVSIEVKSTSEFTSRDTNGTVQWVSVWSDQDWAGNPAWHILKSQTIRTARLLKDAEGEEFIEEEQREIVLPAEVIEWPKEFRKTALSIGPRNRYFDSTVKRRSKRHYTDLRWQHVATPYSELLRYDRFHNNGRYLIHAIVSDSVKSGKFDRDTSSAEIDDKGRVASFVAGVRKNKYYYNDQRELIRIEERYGESYEAKWLERILATDSSRLVTTTFKINEKGDTSSFRHIRDYSYPAFDDIGKSIDSFATLNLEQGKLTATPAERWRRSLRLVLIDRSGNEIASTTRSAPILRAQLGPIGSVYVLRYIVDGRPVYDRTIVHDDQDQW